MQITKIDKLKNNKYKITFEESKIITFDNVILENNLLYKKYIDIELYNKILKETEYYDIYNRTLKYILKRRKSEKEIREYLIDKGLNTQQIDNIILKLKKINLINDKEYCNAFINDSIYLGKNGINKVRKELLNKGISISIIEEALIGIDENVFENKLEKMIIKKIKLNKKYSVTYLKQKILNEMINLGYEKDKILNILDKNCISDTNITKKEFDKIYIKLSKKYSGIELIKNIKNKMVLKGFNLDEINSLIEQKNKEE